MIAVGIDVSKSKSTVAILDSYGTVLATPFTMAHTQSEMNALVARLHELDGPMTILMEYTGHYHYPVLKKLQDEGFPVCVINPYQMKKYGDVEIHKAKTDKKDALRIATYALEKSYKLVPYSSMEQKYLTTKPPTKPALFFRLVPTIIARISSGSNLLLYCSCVKCLGCLYGLLRCQQCRTNLCQPCVQFLDLLVLYSKLLAFPV